MFVMWHLNLFISQARKPSPSVTLQKRKRPRWSRAARGIVCKSGATWGSALQRNGYISPRELYMWPMTLSQMLCNYSGGTELWRMTQSTRKFLGIWMSESKGNGSLFSLQGAVGRQWSNWHLWKLWKGLKFLLANRCTLGKHCKVEACNLNSGVAFSGRIINIWTILPSRSKNSKKNKGMNEIKREQVKKIQPCWDKNSLLSSGIGCTASHKCFAQPFKGISELSCQLQF